MNACTIVVTKCLAERKGFAHFIIRKFKVKNFWGKVVHTYNCSYVGGKVKKIVV
jgi:hypothetical protein